MHLLKRTCCVDSHCSATMFMFCATAFGFPEPRGDVQSHVRHYSSKCALHGVHHAQHQNGTANPNHRSEHWRKPDLDDSDPSLKEKFQEEKTVFTNRWNLDR